MKKMLLKKKLTLLVRIMVLASKFLKMKEVVLDTCAYTLAPTKACLQLT